MRYTEQTEHLCKTLSPWCGYTRNTRILFLNKKTQRTHKEPMLEIRENRRRICGIIWHVIVMFIAPLISKQENKNKWELYQIRIVKKGILARALTSCPSFDSRHEVIISVLHPNKRYQQQTTESNVFKM